MNIKEIEQRSGMERSNIYYYEKEGLLSPNRLSNGYRDYSEEDLDVLLKVKLLRSLHISLDDIRRLKEGNLSLSAMMNQQIYELTVINAKTDYAKNMCEAIREEGSSFEKLDAMKYLSGIPALPNKKEEIPVLENSRQTSSNKNTSTEEAIPFSSENQEQERILPPGMVEIRVLGTPYEIHAQTLFPWRRCFARAIDTAIYVFLIDLLFRFVFGWPVSNQNIWMASFATILSTILMLLMEPLFLHFFGATPGKWMWGLKLRDASGNNLSLPAAFFRTWGVFLWGFGLNIPIWSTYRQWKCYKQCEDHRLLPWEVDIPTQYTCKDTKVFRPILYVAANILYIILTLLVERTEILPPNRGDLTIEEFAENYNYYAKHYGIGFSNYSLDSDGNWEYHPELTGTYTISTLEYNNRPVYQYELDENGYVSGVSFTLTVNKEVHIVHYPEHQMYLISMALVGSEPKVDIFQNFPVALQNYIQSHSFENYSTHFSDYGFFMESSSKLEGYEDTYSSWTNPKKDADKYKASIYFNIHK